MNDKKDPEFYLHKDDNYYWTPSAHLDYQETKAKLKSIEDYCISYKEFMWAAKIWAIINDADFRDIATATTGR